MAKEKTLIAVNSIYRRSRVDLTLLQRCNHLHLLQLVSRTSNQREKSLKVQALIFVDRHLEGITLQHELYLDEG